MSGNDTFRLVAVLLGVGVLVLIVLVVVVWNLLSRGMASNRVRRRSKRLRVDRDDPDAPPRPKLAPPPSPPPAPAAAPAAAVLQRQHPARAEGYCYDKAIYHEAMVPPDLPPERSLVPTGLFLAWAVDAGLVSRMFLGRSSNDVAVHRNREAAPWRLYHVWNGSLDADMLTDEGNAFARRYFDLSGGALYERDFKVVLAQDLPSPFHVAGTWEEYDRLKARLDKRFAGWKRAEGS